MRILGDSAKLQVFQPRPMEKHVGQSGPQNTAALKLHPSFCNVLLDLFFVLSPENLLGGNALWYCPEFEKVRRKTVYFDVIRFSEI